MPHNIFNVLHIWFKFFLWCDVTYLVCHSSILSRTIYSILVTWLILCHPSRPRGLTFRILLLQNFFRAMLGPCKPDLNFNCILKNFLLLIGSEKKSWLKERMEINSDVSEKGWLILSARGILVRHVKWLTCGYFLLGFQIWILICLKFTS